MTGLTAGEVAIRVTAVCSMSAVVDDEFEVAHGDSCDAGRSVVLFSDVSAH